MWNKVNKAKLKNKPSREGEVLTQVSTQIPSQVPSQVADQVPMLLLLGGGVLLYFIYKQGGVRENTEVAAKAAKAAKPVDPFRK